MKKNNYFLTESITWQFNFVKKKTLSEQRVLILESKL